MLCSQCGSSALTLVSAYLSDGYSYRDVEGYIGSKTPFKQDIGISEDYIYIYDIYIYIYGNPPPRTNL